MKVTTIYHETIDCKFADFNGDIVKLIKWDDTNEDINLTDIVYISND